MIKETTQLAYDLIRLEQLAKRYEARFDQVRADRVWWQREQIQFQRSRLLRQAWAWRRLVTA